MKNSLEQIENLLNTYPDLDVNDLFTILTKMYNVKSDHLDKNSLLYLTKNDVLTNNSLNEDIKEAFMETIEKYEKETKAKSIHTEVQGVSKISKGRGKENLSPEMGKQEGEIKIKPEALEARKEVIKEHKYAKLYSTLEKLFHDSEYVPADLKRYKGYVNTEEEAKAFYTFMYMLPTSSKSKKLKWDAAMKVTYNGVTLRRVTKAAAKKYIALYKKHGKEAIALALFRYLKDGIKDGQCFIRKVDNFFAEFEDWKAEVEDSIDPKLESGDASIEVTDVSLNTNRRLI